MKEYFTFQYNMLNRKLRDFGFSPISAYILVIIIFYSFSIYLFSKTEFAEYLYGLISLSLISKLSEKRRNDFLKIIFSVKGYKKLRTIENLILALPFLIFLLYNQLFLVSIILTSLSILMSFFNFNNSFNYTIPTPFSKKPFEFPSGFRGTFFIFPFAYFLTFQSILVGNFNLGVFAILLIAVVVLSYYSKPENEFFVWSFSLSPKAFLMNKIKIGLLYSTLLNLPVIISLMIFFPNETITLMIFLLLSYFSITTIILAKYSAYPNEINLPEFIILGISLMAPALLLFIIPYFFTKSITQLNLILKND